MRLYHFTGLWRLVGPDGLRAMQAVGGESLDANDFAEPGYILRAGLRPQPDRLLGDMIPPCIWFTTDPDMPLGFSSNSDFRIEVVIPTTDRQLVQWPAYLRKRDPSGEALAAYQREAARHVGRVCIEDWWFYLAPVTTGRFRSIEHIEEREEDRRHYEAITEETAMREAA
jgi:hypothetical protein